MSTLQSLLDDGASWIGQRIGNYQLVRLLGAGGMGMVFEAVHVTAGGQAAIKILRPEVAVRQDIVARFFNEARAANSISHPSIVSVFDCGYTANGSAYLAMEFLSGDTLQKRLSNFHQLEIGNSLQIARQLASALNAAHQRHVIHRDLKPENIMLVPDLELSGGERVKILDFGIAKVAERPGGELVRTRTGMFLGTPTYMAPEQCRGAKHVTDKSDVYSLGIILYQMLAGKPPFVGDSIGELIAMHLTDEPVPLADVIPHVEPQMSALVHAMLDKKASARPDMGLVLRIVQQLESHAVALAPHAVREGITPTAIPAAQIQADVIATPDLLTLDSRSRQHPAVENSALRQGSQSEPVQTPEGRNHQSDPPTAPLMQLNIGAPVELQLPLASEPPSSAAHLLEKSASHNPPFVETATAKQRRSGRISRFWLGASGLIGLSLIIVASISHLRRHRAHSAGDPPTIAHATPQIATPDVSPLVSKTEQGKDSAGQPTSMASERTEALDKQIISDATVPPVERALTEKEVNGSAGSQLQRDQVVTLIQQGRKMLDAGKPAAAAVLFSRAVQLEEGSAEALGGLGESNFRQGKFDRAASQLATAVSLEPQGALAYQEILAKALYKTGRFRASAELCRKILKQTPTSVIAKQTLQLAEKEQALVDDTQALKDAQIEYNNGNFEKAIAKSQLIVQRYPIKAWRIIGTSACNIKEIRLANDAFKRLDAPGKQFMTFLCQQHGIKNTMDGFRLSN